jgi:histidinol phosphatase-like PHP family hydrolase
VLGCCHSALGRNEDQTERYLAALRNPDIQILGHPRGRIYNFRLGLHAEWEKVFATAADMDKAVEIDGYPTAKTKTLNFFGLRARRGCEFRSAPTRMARVNYVSWNWRQALPLSLASPKIAY